MKRRDMLKLTLAATAAGIGARAGRVGTKPVIAIGKQRTIAGKRTGFHDDDTAAITAPTTVLTCRTTAIDMT